ncbi:MAG: Uma2 family endonuclease [Thiobacillaceae bacterium]|jgi:Uma2 family endonuclease|nr:Uma2 family endonuclease [Thiobacillaceae bacterium]
MGHAQPHAEHYTVADYLTWPDDVRCELIHGVVYDMSPAPVIEHQVLVGKLHLTLASCVDKNGGGGGSGCAMLLSPVDVVLAADTVVQPDLIVVCDPAKLANGKNVQGAPDFVLEVLSPATAAKDKREKRALYESAGVREYLIVDPIGRYAELHTLGADGRYPAPAVLAAEDALRLAVAPELSLTLHELFDWPLPQAVRQPLARYG